MWDKISKGVEEKFIIKETALCSAVSFFSEHLARYFMGIVLKHALGGIYKNSPAFNNLHNQLEWALTSLSGAGSVRIVV